MNEEVQRTEIVERPVPTRTETVVNTNNPPASRAV